MASAHSRWRSTSSSAPGALLDVIRITWRPSVGSVILPGSLRSRRDVDGLPGLLCSAGWQDQQARCGRTTWLVVGWGGWLTHPTVHGQRTVRPTWIAVVGSDKAGSLPLGCAVKHFRCVSLHPHFSRFSIYSSLPSHFLSPHFPLCRCGNRAADQNDPKTTYEPSRCTTVSPPDMLYSTGSFLKPVSCMEDCGPRRTRWPSWCANDGIGRAGAFWVWAEPAWYWLGE